MKMLRAKKIRDIWERVEIRFLPEIAGLGGFLRSCDALNFRPTRGFALLHAAARNWISHSHPSDVPSASSSRDCHWAQIQQYLFHLHALPDNTHTHTRIDSARIKSIQKPHQKEEPHVF